ncbi:hypothetical protein [uncultured Agitococcus sp.]|uniref:hypothetical protein n=1 Tax=uncultured Agitococcus sp. TaxID=1506599 RepID=UPI00263917D3|nr:hypothetical protein [uncultured Agitococcus sp.]
MDLYVLIVSDHNLAELRACLYYKPRHIWLVASQRMQKPAQRLFDVLKQQFAPEQLDILQAVPNVPFDGNTLQETDDWIKQVFTPQIKQFNNAAQQQCVLNMTGGTKTLSYLLTRAYAWQEIHYQPFGNKVPLERFCLSTQGLNILPNIDLANVTISPKDNALLYMDYVRPHTPNAIRKHPNSLPLALSRLEYPQEWKKITDLLEQGWQQNETSTFVSVTCSQEINAEFIMLLNSVIESKPAPLSLNQQTLTLPSLHYKAYQKWRKWVSGDWYEQLIEHWLTTEYQIKPEHILTNVQLSNKTDPQGQESDTLLQFNNKLYVIEIKADIPKYKTLGEMESQLTSLSEQLGKVEKVLIVSPMLKAKYSNEQWLSFELRCKGKNVKLLTVGTKEDLKALFTTVS